MTPTQKTSALVVGGVAFVAAVLLISRGGSTPTTTLNYCTDAVYYTRSCEASPYSVAAGTPGYAGQICGAHTYAMRGDDLFTYAYMDQGGARSYARPPAAAGAVALAKWDDCFVAHNPAALGLIYPCATAHAPAGTQQYHPLTWAQLPPGPQKTAWGTKYGCAGVTPVPSVTTPPSGTLVCVTATPVTFCLTKTP